MDEGVTKFACTWRPAPPPPAQAVAGLCGWRQRLHARGLVGHDSVHDVGFGNLSVRAPDGALYVSGTQTGGAEVLGPEHVARITDYDLEANHVGCEGPVQASSESLTHLALYELGPGVGGVIHVHAPELWARLRGVAPTTDPAVPYGTPAMAREVARLARAHPEGGVIVMAGHPDGLVAYGADLDAAGARLLAASEGSA